MFLVIELRLQQECNIEMQVITAAQSPFQVAAARGLHI